MKREISNDLPLMTWDELRGSGIDINDITVHLDCNWLCGLVRRAVSRASRKVIRGGITVRYSRAAQLSVPKSGVTASTPDG